MQRLDAGNYTGKRMENFIKGIDEIHKALVEHSPHPRNMTVLMAIWIDFDRAQAFHLDILTEQQKEWVALEDKRVVEVERDTISNRFMMNAMIEPGVAVVFNRIVGSQDN